MQLTMNYLEKAQQMYQMIDSNQIFEALEQFYHEDVTVIEADGTVRNGKEAQRNAVKEWFGMLQEYHDGGTTAVSADEEKGITMVESWGDMTFKDGSRVKMEEVAVQHWEGDQIVKERFYYNTAPQE
ncbi:MAG: nuclear transport factor 2 family protein [Bacteroidota bacterium]